LTSVTTAEGVAITGNAKGGLCAWKGGSAGKVI
jgi:hypothetical protein